MGIEVELRGERGEIVEKVRDPQMVLARAVQNSFSGTRLLRDLVPWGDAVFNQAQARDFANDIHFARNANSGTPLSNLLESRTPR